jgi:GntR family transcriptional regulator/MocR family aminotransferase
MAFALTWLCPAVLAKGTDVKLHGTVTKVEQTTTTTGTITVHVVGFEIQVQVTADSDIVLHGDKVGLAGIEVNDFVKVDGFFSSSGIVVDEIPAEASIVCVCPSHQFPLGMAMSEDRRQALLRFARRNGAAIVEDDYDGEFRYEGSPLEALRTRESADRVFYLGSFSKCMFPSIRLGFIVAPQRAMPSLVAAKNCTDWHCSIPLQLAVANFILDGHLARHVRRARRIYRERREHLLQLLARYLDKELAVVPSFYGMHIAALAKASTDCEAISMKLARQGIIIHSLDRYFMGSPRPGFVLSYAAAGTDALTLAIRALADRFARPRA